MGSILLQNEIAFFQSWAAVVHPTAFIWGAPEPTGQSYSEKETNCPLFFIKQDTDSSLWNHGSKENEKF